MVESGCERRESGPVNPDPISLVRSGHSTVLGFTCMQRVSVCVCVCPICEWLREANTDAC